MFKPKTTPQRRPYVKPAIAEISEAEILEAIGPAQGYGQDSMRLDSEWVRKS